MQTELLKELFHPRLAVRGRTFPKKLRIEALKNTPMKLGSEPLRCQPPNNRPPGLPSTVSWGLRCSPGGPLTIAINVHGAGISLAVAVCINLSRVVHIGAVVTAVPNLILVIIRLPGVEQQLAIVLKPQETT